nr:DUF559 domain-containing protein [Sphingomonas sp. dw_22]
MGESVGPAVPPAQPEQRGALFTQRWARAAQRRGRVRGNEAGLTKRQLLPATTLFRSRALRREAGPPERKLRAALRSSLPGAKFRWQVPMGPYHADFCSHAARLIVEVDDETHAPA